MAGESSEVIFYVSQYLPVSEQVESYQRLLEASKLYSKSGIEISSAISLLRDIQEQDSGQEKSERILSAVSHFEAARDYFKSANAELIYIKEENIPREFQGQFSSLYKEALEIEGWLEELNTTIPFIIDLLGYNEERTYLFLFQNNSELRPTGGFIGTYGTMVWNQGSFEELYINGIYDPDGQLREKIIPPKPLQYVTPTWGSRDANWFLSFPSSAKKVIELFEKTGEAEYIDGVIAITPDFVIQLLEATGPIEMEEYDVVITSENFLETIQEEVEVNYNKSLNKPKKILADLTPMLMDEALNEVNYADLVEIIMDSLSQKDIMFYSRNLEAQEFFESRNWAGGITIPTGDEVSIEDFLSVVIINIGGGKTDLFTETYIDSSTVIEEDGSLIRTVWLTRENRGGSTGYPWYDTDNYGYVRFYVPLGSELMDADGFAPSPEFIATNYEAGSYKKDDDVARIEESSTKHEASGTDIFEESGLTVFGNWARVPAQGDSIAHITYRLPFKVSEASREYHLTIHKQPGLEPNYSGIIELKDKKRSVYGCSVAKENIAIPRFRFKQENDTRLSCFFDKII